MTEKNKILFYSREGNAQAGFEVRTLDIISEIEAPRDKSRGSSVRSEASQLDLWPSLAASNGECGQRIKEHFQCLAVSFSAFNKSRQNTISFWNKIIFNIKAFISFLKFKPDILVLQRVNYHTPAALLYFLLYRPGLILDIDDWEFRENIKKYPFGFSSSITENLTRFICKSADYVIVSSEFLMEYFKPYSKKIEKIPSGISGKNFYAGKKITTPRRIVWCGSLDAGRYETFEELRRFIEAFIESCSKELELYLIARGDLISELENLVKNVSRIRIFENIKREEVQAILKECNIGIYPVFRDTYFFKSKSPVKIFEYMKAGLIPVVSDIGESKYIIENEINGYVAGSLQDMVETINKLSKMDGLKLSTIVKNSQKTFLSEYSAKTCAIKWINILNSCLMTTAVNEEHKVFKI